MRVVPPRWLPALLPLLTVVLVSCGRGTEPAPPVPASVLPDLSSEARVLDTDALAADALRPEALAALLGDAGYIIGSERTFRGGSDLRYVVARVLRFESRQGAARYVDWVRSHASDLIGPAEPEDPLAIDGSPLLFSFTPGGCCPKEVPTLLAIWQHDAIVFSLIAAGPGATREAITPLAADLDGIV